MNSSGESFSRCIKEAYRLGLIDEQEKLRLQIINGRGNCAKHKPENLKPDPETDSSEGFDGLD